MPPFSVGPAGFASAPVAPAVKAPQAAPDTAGSSAAVSANTHPHPQVQAPQPLQIDPVAMKQQLQNIAEMLHQQLQRSQSNLGFTVDESAHVFVITVRNLETNEVIRKIPGDEVLKVAHNIESLKGILYHKLI